MFNARKLRHRVNIERKLESRDAGTGEVRESWTPFLTAVPAQIEPLSVREFIASQAMQSQVTARITVRYHAGLTANMRIVHNGKIYNPQGWLADTNSGLKYLTAPCSEGVNLG